MKTLSALTLYTATFFCLALPTVSKAAVLVKYDFDELLGDEASLAASQTDAHLNAGNISRGPEYGPTTNSAFTANALAFSPGLVNTNNTFLSNYNLATAVSLGAYFELTLEVEDGYALNIDTIQFATRRASNSSGPNQFAVRSSLDGYTTDLLSGISLTVGTAADPFNQSLNFGSQLQGITGSITLRFYGYTRNAENTSYGIWAISNHTVDEAFTVNGTISPIPEPSVYALMLLGGLTFVCLHRKKR